MRLFWVKVYIIQLIPQLILLLVPDLKANNPLPTETSSHPVQELQAMIDWMLRQVLKITYHPNMREEMLVQITQAQSKSTTVRADRQPTNHHLLWITKWLDH